MQRGPGDCWVLQIAKSQPPSVQDVFHPVEAASQVLRQHACDAPTQVSSLYFLGHLLRFCVQYPTALNLQPTRKVSFQIGHYLFVGDSTRDSRNVPLCSLFLLQMIFSNNLLYGNIFNQSIHSLAPRVSVFPSHYEFVYVFYMESCSQKQFPS